MAKEVQNPVRTELNLMAAVSRQGLAVLAVSRQGLAVLAVSRQGLAVLAVSRQGLSTVAVLTTNFATAVISMSQTNSDPPGLSCRYCHLVTTTAS